MTAERTFVDVGDDRIETSRWRAAEEAPATIVLLHQGLGSVAQWQTFPDALVEATGLDVIAYSRRGYGCSSPGPDPYPPDYLHREAIETLAGLLDVMSIDRPILYGHSDGATIALYYAIEYPQAARGLIVESPHVFAEEQSRIGIREVVEETRRADLVSRLSAFHDDAARMFDRWSGAWLSGAHDDWDMRASLGEIRCPLLGLQGDDDVYGTPAHVLAIRDAIGELATVEILACGHSPHREMSEYTLKIVGDFVRRAIAD